MDEILLISIDFNCLHPYIDTATFEKTFKLTTQWAVISTRFPMRKHLKSGFPAFKILQWSDEAVPNETIFSDTPAIYSGVPKAQLFIDKTTLVADVHCLKSTKQFVNTLENNIYFQGAMIKLFSDCAQVEISNKVKDILGMCHSSSWNSEPYHWNPKPG